jgi:electron transfer flavoprotein beta subunit
VAAACDGRAARQERRMSVMRIAVGFKVTPDWEALRPADWARVAAAEGPEGRAEAVRFVRRVPGVFDEAALELALRLRDARADAGLETELSAFTVGGREADPLLATLQALGFAVARVDTGAAGEVSGPDGPATTGGVADGGIVAGSLDFAPAATAALVAACARRLDGDVLLLGERGSPDGSGLVPFLAAESLGRPCVAGVTAITPAPSERLRVTFSADDGPVRAVVTPPCVLAVGNAVVSMLRVPTLKDRLAARDRPVAEYAPARLDVDLAALPEGASLLRLEAVDRGRAGAVVPGATPADKARALYEQLLRAHLEKL